MVKVVSKLINIIGHLANHAYERIIRHRLRNENFTILCSNCIGGLIYHRLGLKFLSPTINLWLHQDDFIYFVLHLSYYLENELEFTESEYDYPVGRLSGDLQRNIPDIKIYFNHYKSAEEAKANWDKRKKRINYDNLYLIMYWRDDITIEQLKLLENVNCKNKIIFTDKELDEIKWSLYIKPNMKRLHGSQYMDQDIFGFNTIEKKFDFVKFLNSEEVVLNREQ